MKVKLKDPTKICWDRGQNKVITGPDAVTVEDTKFIRDKIKEGVLVEVKEVESKATEPPEEKPAEKPKKKK